jgi:hypothetical protein
MRVQTVIGALIAGRLAPPILVASAVEVEVIKVGGDDVGGVWWIEQEGVLNLSVLPSRVSHQQATGVHVFSDHMDDTYVAWLLGAPRIILRICFDTFLESLSSK